MIGTLAAIIGLSTLFFTAILYLLNVNLLLLPILVVAFNITQWLIAPYLIDAMYNVREVSRSENPWLHRVVERLSERSGIRKPRVMLAQIPIPNAFAYGSPIAGSRVAVTQGLLDTLEPEEVEAVIGHELGHLKHRDVQVMMFVSMLPAIFYYLGYSLLLSSGYGRREEEGGGALAIGMLSLFLYWVLTLLTLHLSRLREYFADRHSATIVEDGPRKLSEALAKIQYAARRLKLASPHVSGLHSFKSLFITDPDRAELDVAELTGYSSPDQRLVQEILRRRVTLADQLMELFSTHPNIVKRIRALKELERQLA